MRNIKIILFIFTLALFLCGCSNVINTPESEVINSYWVTETSSGIKAEFGVYLSDNTASLVINEGNSVYEIKGTFAIDSNDIVIISQDLLNSYQFKYKVFENRLELTYKDNTLVFQKNKPQ